MNGAFIREQAAALAKSVESEPDATAEAASSVSQDSGARPERQGARSRAQLLSPKHASANTPKCCCRPTRRSSGHDAQVFAAAMIQSLCGGLGAIGLTGMLSGQQAQAATLGHYTGPRLPAKAKHVIFLFMAGGPSQVDMFDPKPVAAEVSGAASGLGGSADRAPDWRPAAEPVRVQKVRARAASKSASCCRSSPR